MTGLSSFSSAFGTPGLGLAGLRVAGLGLRSSDRPRIFTVFLLPYARGQVYKARDDRDNIDCRLLIARVFEIAIAIARRCTEVPQGYPVPTSKKKRVYVVTYRHSGEHLSENSVLPRSNVNDL
jgi:hypothetical protein